MKTILRETPEVTTVRALIRTIAVCQIPYLRLTDRFAAVAQLQQLPRGQLFSSKSRYAAPPVAVRLAGGYAFKIATAGKPDCYTVDVDRCAAVAVAVAVDLLTQ